jgi:XTP/dITP diphosphohydrolase
MNLVFATNNQNKINEIEKLLNGNFKLQKLNDIGCSEELPETHETIEENSTEKAQYIYSKFHVNCFSEDTGLEVEALNSEPGVYSARYAGEDKDAENNMRKLLEKMKDIDDRRARFKTVITLILNGQEHQFTGILEGNIGFEKKGTNGFGYDPIFVLGDGRTLAELSIDEKSLISHRGIATKKLISYLSNYKQI